MRELRFYSQCPWTIKCVFLSLLPTFQIKYRVCALVEKMINFTQANYSEANANCISVFYSSLTVYKYFINLFEI